MLAFEAAPSAGTKKVRVEHRMSPETKALIERAAYLQGVNASEFVTSQAAAAARETINRLEGTVVTPEDRDAFMRAFDAEPTQALVDIMKLHAEVTAGR